MNRPINAARRALPLTLASVAYAKDMLGVKEDFVDGKWTNWGPEIKKFLFSAGIRTPAPWCGAFVNWCAEQAAFDQHTVSPLEKVKLQAYVPSYVEWAEENDAFVPPEVADVGDLFVLYDPKLKRYAHIGFVTEVDTDEGWFTTIEGNTDDEASREGYKVASRRRAISERIKFIRWY